jgi:iron complex transport system substrate-binding protein
MTSDYSPQRIVSLQPSATQILEALGAVDRVVACTRHCVQLCPAVADRIIVEDSWTAKSAEIAVARPDLVIAAVPFQASAVMEILKAGARFLALAPRTLTDVYRDIVIIARIIGKHDAGKSLIASMQAEIEAVKRQCAEVLNRPLVYCEEWGKPMLRSQPWVAELVEIAGGRFWGNPATPTSSEEVFSADPDVIITAWCGVGDRVPLEKIMVERGWTGLRAVREGRVYCIRDELLTTPAPVLIRGLYALAAATHPELFSGVEGVRQIVSGWVERTG